MSYYGSNESTWLYAHAGATAVIAVPITILGLIDCFKGRKRADPARTGFVWLKAVFALIFLSFVFAIVNSITRAFYYDVLSVNYSSSTRNDWNKISYAMGTISGFFSWMADFALLISFVEIGNGFLYALDRTPSSKRKILRFTTFALMIPLIIMTFVNIGYGGALSAQFMNGSSSGANAAIDKLLDLNYMSAAMNVLLFIYSLLAMIHASFVRHKYRGVEPAGKTVTLYLVATVLTAVPRNLWALIYSCLLAFNNTYFYLDVDVPTRVVLTQLILLITLVLLFVVSTRKQAGLWTELQPWMNGVAPTMTHRHQLYYGVGPNGEAAYYQYPAQGQPAMAYAQPQHQQQQYYGWQPQQQWQQHPYEAPGISPNVVPAGDPAHMLPANGPEPRYADQVHHEMKA